MAKHTVTKILQEETNLLISHHQIGNVFLAESQHFYVADTASAPGTVGETIEFSFVRKHHSQT